MSKNFIAIDPGASGGIAWKIGNETGAFPIPKSFDEIIGKLRALRDSCNVAYIEDIPKFTGVKLPGSVMAVLFHSFGFLEGVLMALGFVVIRTRPQAWQKALDLGTRAKGMSKPEWKRKLKEEAQRRFPDAKISLATSDALLILASFMEVK